MHSPDGGAVLVVQGVGGGRYGGRGIGLVFGCAANHAERLGVIEQRVNKASALFSRPDEPAPVALSCGHRQQRRPQPEARAAERDGDDGLERVGEAVDDHAQLVVAQRAELVTPNQ